jgi:hypothetical protein
MSSITTFETSKMTSKSILTTASTTATTVTSVEDSTIMAVKAPLLGGGNDKKQAVTFRYENTAKTATRCHPKYSKTTFEKASKNTQIPAVLNVKTTKPLPCACHTYHTSVLLSNGLHKHVHTYGHTHLVAVSLASKLAINLVVLTILVAVDSMNCGEKGRWRNHNGHGYRALEMGC